MFWVAPVAGDPGTVKVDDPGRATFALCSNEPLQHSTTNSCKNSVTNYIEKWLLTIHLITYKPQLLNGKN